MQVKLRHPRPQDVKRTYGWLQNQTLRREFMMRTTPDINSHIRYWRPVLEQKLNDMFFSIYFIDKHVGNCGVKSIQSCRTGEAWIYIGDPSAKGQGVGKAAMTQLLHNARTHDLKSLGLHVRADNEPALRLYRKLGFHVVKSGQSGSFGFDADTKIFLMEAQL